MQDRSSRQGLLEAVFNALDRTGKGFLTAADMRPFAEQTGFTGTDREWQLEFEALCHESRSSQGLGLDAFAKLVNDDSEDGCYCTDSELQALLQGLHQGSVENNTSVPNSTPSRTIGQPLQATEARTTHHTIERTYTCGSLGREEGRDGGREGETERGRERERGRGSSHFGSSRECSRPCCHHSARGLLALSSLFPCFRGQQVSTGVLFCPAAVSRAIREDALMGNCVCYFDDGVRDRDIVEIAPAGDRPVIWGSFGRPGPAT